MSKTRRPQSSTTSKPRLLGMLGPGLVTGASDDDPAGIATYSQAGAQFGFTIPWVMIFSYPLMSAVQEISALIGRTTGHGLAGNLCRHYPKWLLRGVVLILFVANTFNLAADLAAMGNVAETITGVPHLLLVVLFGLLCICTQIFMDYSRYVAVLKWTTLSLLTYFGTAMMVQLPWSDVLYGTLIPQVSWSGDFVTTLTAVLGTTISPYLFFWQCSQEAEDERVDLKKKPLLKNPTDGPEEIRRIRFDTYVGMAFANLVALAIIVTTAATLNRQGVTNVETAQQAAEALKPIVGSFAFIIFSIGIIGTGMLAVPVLAGSSAYAVGEAFRWKVGLGRKPREARAFYGIVALAGVIGIILNFTSLNPIKALYWSAVINGIVSAPVMVVMMLMAKNPKIMGKFAIGPVLNGIGWLATAVMALAAVAVLATMFL
ncbi:MAG: divalent metal cation transporter [Xanthobacteraceae bacterium]|nr:divalent metal cation transporter [Xanthobacteraceae bacterium]